MTPCYICGLPLSEIRLDSRDLKIRPCFKCEEIINETVVEYTLKEEEEWYEEDVLSLDEFMERYE